MGEVSGEILKDGGVVSKGAYVGGSSMRLVGCVRRDWAVRGRKVSISLLYVSLVGEMY